MTYSVDGTAVHPVLILAVRCTDSGMVVSDSAACLGYNSMGYSSRFADRKVDTSPAAVSFHLLELVHVNHQQ